MTGSCCCLCTCLGFCFGLHFDNLTKIPRVAVSLFDVLNGTAELTSVPACGHASVTMLHVAPMILNLMPFVDCCCDYQIPGSEPVWRKLLRLFPEIVPGVSQQAGVAGTCDRESTGSSSASCLRRIMVSYDFIN